jgi:hypothetical protein
LEYQGDGDDKTPATDEHSLPIGKPAPIVPPIPIAEPFIQDTVAQQNIDPELSDSHRTEDETKHIKPMPVRVVNDPLSTRVVEDDELSTFERTTIKFGRWGSIVAAATLLVAGGTGIVFYEQFVEMASQTNLLAIAAKQARIEAKDASIATAKQLFIAQEQVKTAQLQADAAQASVKVIQRQFALT